MALDNAEFISELSVLDPPGTDPLNQGDDHIRTTKKAVQQSFPNVGSAVPQTGVQMAQMAIKNEVNLFTQANTFQQLATFNNDITLDSGGTTVINFDKAASRRWQWLYNGPSDAFELRRFVAGALIDAPVSVNNAFGEFTFLADASFGRTILLADGVAAAPAFRFTAQPGTGMYRPGTSLGFAVNGSDAMFLLLGQMRMITSGSAVTPAYSFQDNTNMGMYRIANGILGFAPSGTEQLRMTNVFSEFAGQVVAPQGTAAAPGFAFKGENDSGFFFSPININAVVDATVVWAMSLNGMFAGPGFVIHADGSLTAATKPGFSFDNDGDTGFYRASANVAGIAAAGLSVLQLGNGGIFAGAGFVFQAIGEDTPNKPGYTFSNDTDTGFYRIQANVSGLACAGVQVMSFGTGGVGIRLGTPFFPNLPTSPGFGGSLWNNGGVVNVA